ncbi:hypothetical protein ACFWZ2_38550 [Streptomyces sp. NPDC059002]|uniref:hypothetical protein n=1 Tax=Streptomyces sp. NPDC059002 TaxID=3346690 RepID=UPI0036C2CCAB
MNGEGQAGVKLDDKGRIVSDAGTTSESGKSGGGAYAEAEKTCNAQVPGIQQEFEKSDAQAVEASRKFVACARKNGMPAFPDPDPKDGAVRFKESPDMDAFNKISQLCTKTGQELSGFSVEEDK